MKIERFKTNQKSVKKSIPFKTFAELYDLTLEVHERNKESGLPKYYVHFKRAEIKDGCILIGAFGSGETEKEAIKDYIQRISNNILVINAYSKDRQNIVVPTLTIRK